MGLWSKIKGWLNIGGAKVQLTNYTQTLSRSNPVMSGTVLLKTKSEKQVLSLEVKVVEEFTETKGSGDTKRKETTTTVMGTVKFPDRDPGIGFPLDLKPGEDREQPFTLNVAVTNRLQNLGGVLGGIGKIAAFTSGESLEYYLVAEARVKGAAFATSDRKKITIGK